MLVAANVGLVTRFVWNFCLNKGLIVLFDNIPDCVDLLDLIVIWRHVLGTATAPVPYVLNNGIPALADGKTPATEDQIEAKS